MRTITLTLALLCIVISANAITEEEKRIKSTYGQKYNAKAVIWITNKCVEQYMLLSDTPDPVALKPWCEQKTIDGWKPFSKAELEKLIKAKKRQDVIVK